MAVRPAGANATADYDLTGFGEFPVRGCHFVIIDLGLLDGLDDQNSIVEVGVFHHLFVFADVEVAMDQHDSESVKAVVLLQNVPNLGEAFLVCLCEFRNFVDVRNGFPLHR